jgi:PKD repeat protein
MKKVSLKRAGSAVKKYGMLLLLLGMGAYTSSAQQIRGITVFPHPTVEIEIPVSGELCVGDSLNMHFTGQPPYTLTCYIQPESGAAVPASVFTVYNNDTSIALNNVGDFTVTVVSLIDGNSCNGISLINIPLTLTVNPLPDIDFSAEALSLGEIQFEAISSSSDIVSYRWTFGDGDTSILQDPLHTYMQTGAYSITLSVSTSKNCSADATKSLYITTATDLTADFTVNDDEQCLSTNAFLFSNNSSITAAGHRLKDFIWDFGDGSPVDTNRNASHSYLAAGLYTVTLIAREEPGLSEDTVKKVVKVLDIPQITDTLNLSPVCENSLLGVNTPTVDWKGNTPVSGYWLLDGNVFDPSSQTLSLSDSGKILQYRVITLCGDTLETAAVVSVKEKPGLVNVSNQTFCAGENVPALFFGTQAGVTYRWEQVSGDGVGLPAASGMDSIPAFTAVNGGNIPLVATVMLTAFRDECQGDTLLFTLTVYPKPTLNGNLDGFALCSGSLFDYTIMSNIAGSTCSWERLADTNINNGTVNADTSNRISEYLINTGQYSTDVKYRVTISSDICLSSYIDTLQVQVNPALRLTSPLFVQEVCSESAFQYTITSSAAGAVYSWSRAAVVGINDSLPFAGNGAEIGEVLINQTNRSVNVMYDIVIAYDNCTDTAHVEVEVLSAPRLTLADTLIKMCDYATEIHIPSRVEGILQGEDVYYSVSYSPEAQRAGFVNVVHALLQNDTLKIAVPAGLSFGHYGGVVSVQTQGGCNTTDSLTFYIDRLEPIQIIEQPLSQEICEGDGFALNVKALGSIVSYQWFKDNSAVLGANAPTYTVDSAGMDDIGEYYVLVSGECDTVMSLIAEIRKNPVEVVLEWDNVLDVVDPEHRFVRFQWYKNGVPVYINGQSQYYVGENEYAALNGTYYVRCYYSDNTFAESCPKTFVYTKSPKMNLFPNPVPQNALLTIVMEDSRYDLNGAVLELYDALGKRLSTQTLSGETIKINAPQLPGVYVIRIITKAGEVISERFIVNK